MPVLPSADTPRLCHGHQQAAFEAATVLLWRAPQWIICLYRYESWTDINADGQAMRSFPSQMKTYEKEVKMSYSELPKNSRTETTKWRQGTMPCPDIATAWKRKNCCTHWTKSSDPKFTKELRYYPNPPANSPPNSLIYQLMQRDKSLMHISISK